ncbi:hypothetical protein CVD28_03245 [Bacillus sp. M6-12]|uniref:nuclease-related domain-containing protein n=1 Tax=Bacillus sp. M6-12 TaxID=2054166 RepID=UPI000C773616|nr:nuclease-related domain-containing protein [Bacillus sp. M6-12]PLS19445.1 hypothetical protein CVD28_03245 [Bacillus sp. M6-12]
MDKDDKKLILKYVGLLLSTFMISVLVFLRVFIVPLVIFTVIFSWTPYEVCMVIFLLYFIPQAKKEVWDNYKEEKNELEKERIRLERHESLPTTKVERALQLQPIQSMEALKGIAKDVFESRNYKNEFSSLSISKQINLQPLESRVDNNDRLKLVEKEFAHIQSYSPSHFSNGMSYIRDMLGRDAIQGVPISPIKEILSKMGITPSSISPMSTDVERYQRIYQEALAYLEKEVAIMGAGIGGENRVNEELDMYKGFWKHIPNVRFEVNGQSVESDNIIVSTRGIFTIEVKNYSPKGSYALKITKDGQWIKVFPNGNEEPTNNVTSQMNRHIAFKQLLINQEWEKSYGKTSSPFFFEPIFVIANDTIRIQNDTDLPIMRISQIYHHIMKKPEILTQEQVERLAHIIKINMLPAKKYELKHYESVLEKAYHDILLRESTANQVVSAIDEYVNRGKEELIRLKDNMK